jgi:2-methylcitrate dehydratase PrpD
MVAMRRRVVATVDAAIDEAGADVTAILRDGRREQVVVQHAIGSLERPMSDDDLRAKFGDLVAPVLGAARVPVLAQAAYALGAANDVRTLVQAARAG